MGDDNPKSIVAQFNEYINNRDLDGLAELMTPDHLFVDRRAQINQDEM